MKGEQFFTSNKVTNTRVISRGLFKGKVSMTKMWLSYSCTVQLKTTTTTALNNSDHPKLYYNLQSKQGG